MPDYTTETRTFVGETTTGVNDGYAGFHLGHSYIGVRQADGQVLVLAAGTAISGGVVITAAKWERWFWE